jgi:hypothetical protein
MPTIERLIRNYVKEKADLKDPLVCISLHCHGASFQFDFQTMFSESASS